MATAAAAAAGVLSESVQPMKGASREPESTTNDYTPSPSNKKDQAPSETLGLFLISGLSLAFSVGLSVALFFSLWLWGSLLRGSFLSGARPIHWGRCSPATPTAGFSIHGWHAQDFLLS